MYIRMIKSSVRALSMSAVLVASMFPVALAMSESSRGLVPGVAERASEREVVDAAAVAAFARAHHLTGLSPASLGPAPTSCQGLSPASAQGCSAGVFAATTGAD